MKLILNPFDIAFLLARSRYYFDAGVGEAAAVEGAKTVGEVAAADTAAVGVAEGGGAIAGGLGAAEAGGAVAGGMTAADSGALLAGMGGAEVGAGTVGAVGAGSVAAGAGAAAAGSSVGSAIANSALQYIGQGIAVGAAQTLMGSAAARQSRSPNAPQVPGSQVMPTADSAAIQKAQTDAIIAQMARSGRSSTIMTGGSGNNNKLGG